MSDTPEHTSSWVPVDLTDAVNGADVPPPTVLTRTDGVAMLYAYRTHQFFGASETCKSWAAIHAAAQELRAGRRVLWIDFEDDERGVVSRLRALAIDGETILANFVYVHPDEPLRKGDRYTQGGVDFARLLAPEQQFSLAVVDGVTEAMTAEGLDYNDNADIAVWSRLVAKSIAARGAAVVVIDHVPKGADGPRHAIGGQHKLANLTGASYRFEAERELARAVNDPVEGIIAIYVTKDRPGYVRSHAAPDKRIGTMTLTSYPDGGVTVCVEPPGQARPDFGIMVEIAEYIEVYDGASLSAIEKGIGGNSQRIREALRWMADTARTWVTVTKVGQAHRHSLTDVGRKELL